MLSITHLNLARAILAVVAVAPIATALGPPSVGLRSAANYTVLAKSGVSTVPPSSITGDIAISPIAATALTGFSLTLDSTGAFSRSSQVTGLLFGASYTVPTPLVLTVAIRDMQAAFDDANGRIDPDFTNIGLGLIGGIVFEPGLYKWPGAVSATEDVTIAGTANDTWIFQIPTTFSIGAGKKIILQGGAQRENIVWVISTTMIAGAGSHLEGVFLVGTAATLITGASLNGRIFSQTAVALQQATIVG